MRVCMRVLIVAALLIAGASRAQGKMGDACSPLEGCSGPGDDICVVDKSATSGSCVPALFALMGIPAHCDRPHHDSCPLGTVCNVQSWICDSLCNGVDCAATGQMCSLVFPSGAPPAWKCVSPQNPNCGGLCSGKDTCVASLFCIALPGNFSLGNALDFVVNSSLALQLNGFFLGKVVTVSVAADAAAAAKGDVLVVSAPVNGSLPLHNQVTLDLRALAAAHAKLNITVDGHSLVLGGSASALAGVAVHAGSNLTVAVNSGATALSGVTLDRNTVLAFGAGAAAGAGAGGVVQLGSIEGPGAHDGSATLHFAGPVQVAGEAAAGASAGAYAEVCAQRAAIFVEQRAIVAAHANFSAAGNVSGADGAAVEVASGGVLSYGGERFDVDALVHEAAAMVVSAAGARVRRVVLSGAHAALNLSAGVTVAASLAAAAAAQLTVLGNTSSCGAGAQVVFKLPPAVDLAAAAPFAGYIAKFDANVSAAALLSAHFGACTFVLVDAHGHTQALSTVDAAASSSAHLFGGAHAAHLLAATTNTATPHPDGLVVSFTAYSTVTPSYYSAAAPHAAPAAAAVGCLLALLLARALVAAA